MSPEILPQQIIPPTEAHTLPEPKKTFTKTQISLIVGIIILVLIMIVGGFILYPNKT